MKMNVERHAFAVQQEKVLKALISYQNVSNEYFTLNLKRTCRIRKIASELGISIQSVYNAVFKSLRSVRKKLPSVSTFLFFYS